jgi:hypothetical protein
MRDADGRYMAACYDRHLEIVRLVVGQLQACTDFAQLRELLDDAVLNDWLHPGPDLVRLGAVLERLRAGVPVQVALAPAASG